MIRPVPSLLSHLLPIFLVAGVHSTLAGSATWNTNPISNDWNDPANWTPQNVPQEQTDVATLGVSIVTNPTFSNWPDIFLGELVFNPGASSYTIGGTTLDFFGPGLINNSGIPQTVDTDIGVEFWNASRAGDNVTYMIHPDDSSSYFADASNAGTATFFVDGLIGSGYEPGAISFSGGASAGDSTIVLATGDVYGGEVTFEAYSNAGGSNITAAPKAFVGFGDFASAATSTITADGTRVYFGDNSNGGIATVTLTNGSLLDLSNHEGTADMTIGPLTTDDTSSIDLGSTTLNFVGPGYGSYVSTIAGVISGQGGIVLGKGTEVTLSGANTYSGGTSVKGFSKVTVAAAGASAVGTGPVTIVDGSIGGFGLISGPVTIGGGHPVTSANLIPAITKSVSLKIKASLTFSNQGQYQWRVNPARIAAPTVAAKGITIQGNAIFAILGGGVLPVGTVFTALSNTAKTPIIGTFSNLRDGGTLESRGSVFQANYEGGDGNDLTLTVISNGHAEAIPPKDWA